jgi:hypothetical protein
MILTPSNKALQAIPIGIGTVLCGREVAWRHNAVVAGASALPVPIAIGMPEAWSLDAYGVHAASTKRDPTGRHGGP